MASGEWRVASGKRGGPKSRGRSACATRLADLTFDHFIRYIRRKGQTQEPLFGDSEWGPGEERPKTLA